MNKKGTELKMEIHNKSTPKSKYLQGGWLMALKAVAAIVIVFLIEQFLHLFTKKDALGLTLAPFHNNYFSFSKYYLTNIALSSEFSTTPSATARFIVYAVFGFIILLIISFIILLIPILKKYSERLIAILFYILILGSFCRSFFFPDRKAILDMDKKEIIVINYHYLFIPSNEHIAFNKVESFDYDYSSGYDGYNKQYVFYLEIVLRKTDGRKIFLGEIEAGDQKGKASEKPEAQIPTKFKVMAENVVLQMNQAISMN